MGVVNYTEVTKMVIGIINADSASGFATTVTDAKRSTGEIKEAILEADADVVLAYLDNLRHPYRAQFTDVSTDLAHGDEIPVHIGKHGKVVIKINSADSFYEPGVLAPSVEMIRQLRVNRNNRYGTLAHNALLSPIGGRYRIEDNKLYFTGSAAKIVVPTFAIDRATPACQAHEAHTSLVVSGAVAKLYKEGVVTVELHELHRRIASEGLAQIRAVTNDMTPFDAAVRAEV